MRNIPLKSRKIWFISVLAWRDEQQQQDLMPATERIQSSQYQYHKENLMIKLSHIISEMKKNYAANPTLHDFYVSPDIMENPTYDANSVSNILSCSILPDFLTETTLMILTVNMLNDITLVNT